MPDVGASVDRRALTEAVRVTGKIRCLVCFACGQVTLDNGDESSGRKRDQKREDPTRQARDQYVCEKCFTPGDHMCQQCEETKANTEFAEHFAEKCRPAEEWRCLACQFPSCIECGRKRDQKREQPPRRAPVDHVCDACGHRCQQCDDS